MYYALVMIAVMIFGGCFFLNDAYRKERGSSIVSSMEAAFVGSVAGIIVLLAVSGFDFQATPFTLCIAFISALCGVVFTWCSFKALDRVNLSVYSVFSMLGGMALPFFQGILFYRESITVAKVICVIFICIALVLTLSKDRKGGGTLYYIGIFVLNGMSGVLSKIFTSSNFEKTNAEWYSIWGAVFTAAISGILWLCLTKKAGLPRFTWKAFTYSAVNGSVNRIANFLLVLALVHIDASVQYPLITGGVMIVSTLICYFGRNKPTKKELLSVLMAFIGMLSLFLIKI